MIREGEVIRPIENYLPQLQIAFEKHGVVLAYVYGSQATGNANALSDVDIAVSFPREVDARARGLIASWK